MTKVRPPREHFMRAVDDEFSKFERKERAFRRAEREERATQLGFPLHANDRAGREPSVGEKKAKVGQGYRRQKEAFTEL